MRVSPFGHLRIIAHLQLPAAFRSLSRPSSAPGAKASALRPNSLDQLLFDLYGSRLLFSLELVVFPTVMRSFPHVPRSFPGAIIFRYLCDNASIDVIYRGPFGLRYTFTLHSPFALRLGLIKCSRILFFVCIAFFRT